MTEKHFFELAKEYEFTDSQAAFFAKYVSPRPHTHTADQIEDLDETIAEIVEEEFEE